MPQFSPERGLDPAVAGAIRDETAVNVATAGDSALGQVVSQAGEWIDSNIKNKAIEARAVSASTRQEQMQVRKEGRAGVMAQAERDRQEALYADPESRESKALALETSKTEAEIAKSKAAAGKYGAEAEYARAGKGKAADKKRQVGKLSDVDKERIKMLKSKTDMLHPEKDKQQLLDINRDIDGILARANMTDEQIAELTKLGERRTPPAATPTTTPTVPTEKPTITLGSKQGPSPQDMARIAREYAQDKPLSKQEILEIYQAEQLEQAGVGKPTLSPQLYQRGMLGGMQAPRRL